MAHEQRDAEVTNALAALEASDAAPNNTRATRKASVLAALAMASAPPDAKAKITASARGAVARLSASPDVCPDTTLATDVERAAGRYSAAGDLAVRAAEACETAASTVSAAHILRLAERCPEAIRVVEKAWPRVPSDAWISLMDAVHECSTSVSLRVHLSFVPEAVRNDYFALLEQRAEAAERSRQEYARAEQKREAEVRHQYNVLEGRSRCSGHCSQASSHCMASCMAHGPCVSRCQALESACLAGCP